MKERYQIKFLIPRLFENEFETLEEARVFAFNLIERYSESRLLSIIRTKDIPPPLPEAAKMTVPDNETAPIAVAA